MCDRDPETVVDRATKKEQMTNTIGWCLAIGLVAAVICGAGKLCVDVMNRPKEPPRRKRPWEL
jgi:hypothetical protein